MASKYVCIDEKAIWHGLITSYNIGWLIYRAPGNILENATRGLIFFHILKKITSSIIII